MESKLIFEKIKPNKQQSLQLYIILTTEKFSHGQELSLEKYEKFIQDKSVVNNTFDESFNYQRNGNYIYENYSIDLELISEQDMLSELVNIYETALDKFIKELHYAKEKTINDISHKVTYLNLIKSLNGRELFLFRIKHSVHYDYDYWAVSDIDNIYNLKNHIPTNCRKIIFDISKEKGNISLVVLNGQHHYTYLFDI